MRYPAPESNKCVQKYTVRSELPNVLSVCDMAMTFTSQSIKQAVLLWTCQKGWVGETKRFVRRWYLRCAMNLPNQSQLVIQVWKAVRKERRMGRTCVGITTVLIDVLMPEKVWMPHWLMTLTLCTRLLDLTLGFTLLGVPVWNVSVFHIFVNYTGLRMEFCVFWVYYICTSLGK
jgi:hypothetical protein